MRAFNQALQPLTHKVDKIMSAIDDLKAADVALAAVVQTVVADLGTLAANLAAALAANDPAAIEAEVAKIDGLASTLKTAADAAVPPAA